MRLATPRLPRWPVLAALAVALPACAVHAYPPVVGGYATVYAESVPADIYAYPRVYYGGGYAYLVGERWYYPTGDGWVVLRAEPPELYQYRARYYAGRPVYGGRYYRGYNVAPPAPVAPQYGYPPPATRIR